MAYLVRVDTIRSYPDWIRSHWTRHVYETRSHVINTRQWRGLETKTAVSRDQKMWSSSWIHASYPKSWDLALEPLVMYAHAAANIGLRRSTGIRTRDKRRNGERVGGTLAAHITETSMLERRLRGKCGKSHCSYYLFNKFWMLLVFVGEFHKRSVLALDASSVNSIPYKLKPSETAWRACRELQLSANVLSCQHQWLKSAV